MDKKAIGKRIQKFRKRKRLIQTEIARALDVNRSTMSRIERGHGLPTVKQLLKMHDVYGVSMDWILCGNGPMMMQLTESLPLTGENRECRDIDELKKLFEEMMKDTALRHFILSSFYLYMEEIRKKPVRANDG